MLSEVGSRPGFLSIEVTAAVFKYKETEPDVSEMRDGERETGNMLLGER